MGIKLIAICFFCVMSFSCAVSNLNNIEYPNEIKYAVAYCLSRAYPDSEFSQDAAHISGAYLQSGDYGINMYEEIRSFVDAYRTKELLSKHGKNLDIMQCINLYESIPLKTLIKEIANNSMQPTDSASAD
jgi:hypothetical protein